MSNESNVPSQPLEIDTAQAIRFLDLLDATADRDVAAIREQLGSGKPKIEHRRFLPAENADLAAWIKEKNSAGWNVYYLINPARKTQHKPAKSDMIRANYLHVDIDPRAGEDLDEEKERIFRLLTKFTPQATFIVFSGGGFQAGWRLQTPMALDGESGANTRLVEAYNRLLETKLGGDNCHNVDRILRLPGTINWPDARKRKKGRIPQLARMVEFDLSRTYGLEAFPAPPPLLPASEARSIELIVPTSNVELSALATYGLAPWALANIEHGNDIATLEAVHRANGSRLGPAYKSRSEACFAATCEMLRRGVPDEVVKAVLLDPRYGISSSIREKKNADKYASRQIREARKEIDSPGVDIGWPDIDSHGNVKPTFRNAYAAIKASGIVAEHDVFRDRLRMGGHPFGGSASEVTDYTIALLRQFLIERFDVDFRKANVNDAAIAVCLENPVNPVASYLDGLRHDGVARIDRWLVDYMGAEDTPFNRIVGRKVLLAAVRRIRQPGAKFDTVLVLEGKQGAGKSQALQILAGDYFSDATILGCAGREQQEAVSGVWIYELAELSGLKTTDREFIKAFVSRQSDRARPAYGLHSKDQPRTCVFVGTTNDGEYLRDTTGNRRFWPVKVGRVDLRALRRDRDQLWAEASEAERTGEDLTISPQYYAEAERQQAERVVSHPWSDLLSGIGGELVHGQYRVSRKELFEALKIDPRNQAALSSQLTAAMRGIQGRKWQGPKKMRIFKGEDPVIGFWRDADDLRSEEPDDSSDLPERGEPPF